MVELAPGGQSGGYAFTGDSFALTKPTNAPLVHYVEIGSWRGRSTAYMGVEIANSGKNIRFDAVDTWAGSIDEPEHQNDPAAVNDTLYNEFLANIEPVQQYITPVRMTSLEAAGTYADNSLDFVFIDAQHDYDSVHADILAWWPKVKIGGVIAGHDYNTGPDENGVDYGVGKAVRELLPDHQPLPWCWGTQKMSPEQLKHSNTL
jgi:hypothetical protein